MRFDLNVTGALATASAEAIDAERDGYTTAWAGERSHDPFVWATLAAAATSRIQVATGVAIAFARSPMTVAVAATDINELSGGRFTLGLGTQTQAHIERRYSMPWSAPARRMREYIGALRAIWQCWTDGSRLEFNGEFYQHNLMPAAFRPEPLAHGAPRVLLAAVGPRLAAVAGEVADGLWAHPFTTPRYLDEVTLPQLMSGAATTGRQRCDLQVAGTVFAVTGSTDEEMALATAAVRREIAFYASTPDYRPVLDRHGLGGVQDALLALPAAERERELPHLIGDEVVDTFAVVGPPAGILAQVAARFDSTLDRATLYTPYPLAEATREAIRLSLPGSSIAPPVN